MFGIITKMVQAILTVIFAVIVGTLKFVAHLAVTFTKVTLVLVGCGLLWVVACNFCYTA